MVTYTIIATPLRGLIRSRFFFEIPIALGLVTPGLMLCLWWGGVPSELKEYLRYVKSYSFLRLEELTGV
jgi:hypothetical protein